MAYRIKVSAITHIMLKTVFFITPYIRCTLGFETEILYLSPQNGQVQTVENPASDCLLISSKIFTPQTHLNSTVPLICSFTLLFVAPLR